MLTSLAKVNPIGTVSPEKRGRHGNRVNQMGDEKITFAITSNLFPKIEIHYCRKETRRQYLSGELSVEKMYDHYSEDRKK